MSNASPQDPVRALSNRIFLRISGRWFRAYSIVVHTGARTGRQYRNPVSAYPLADGFVIPVLYGRESRWVRNALATGHLTLRTRSRDHVLTRPELIGPARAFAAFPWWQRAVLRARGIEDYLFARQA